MTNQNRDYCLGLSYFHKIGPASVQKLKNYFPDIATAFRASAIDLEKAGLLSALVDEFVGWRRTFSPDMAWAELEREKIRFMTWNDAGYPLLLKEICAAPPFLYYKGTIKATDGRLAVVGSRRHSAYADKVVTTLIPALANYRIEVVSGLALGVDTLAHRAALDSGGMTLAVLGSGLKNIYPRDNARLAEQIITSGGALISEFPPDTPPYKNNFPRRNRLISGLSQATLVVEAGAKSGALITAAYALEQNREVLAVPGPIFSEFSAGPNKLIKDGATVVTEAADILRIFKIELTNDDAVEKTKIATAPDLKNANEKTIYKLIKIAAERSEKITADEIGKMSKLDTAIINSTLSILEIREMIVSDGSGYSLK
jgi:DNA processing protein